MRKIEDKMIFAIRSGVRAWQHGNTSVTREAAAGYIVARVRLHGHVIAEVNQALGVYRVCLAGWDTVTTRSRISAILRAMAGDADTRRQCVSRRYPEGLGVSSRKTKNGQRIRLHDARGMTDITVDGWHGVQL